VASCPKEKGLKWTNGNQQSLSWLKNSERTLNKVEPSNPFVDIPIVTTTTFKYHIFDPSKYFLAYSFPSRAKGRPLDEQKYTWETLVVSIPSFGSGKQSHDLILLTMML
jgi:hypothetical protein